MPSHRHARGLLAVIFVSACAASGGGHAASPGANSAAPAAGQSTATVGKSEAPATSDLNPDEVAKEVRRHLGEVKACYEHFLKLDRSLKGTIVVHWTISTAGAVTALNTEENTMESEEVAACIEAVVSRWRFRPYTGDPVDVSFPFVFQSRP